VRASRGKEQAIETPVRAAVGGRREEQRNTNVLASPQLVSCPPSSRVRVGLWTRLIRRRVRACCGGA